MKHERGEVATAVLATIVGLVLVAGLVLVGWRAGWWLNESVQQHQVDIRAKVNRRSYEVQQTYREEVLKDMEDVRALDAQLADPAYASSAPQLRAQRIAAINKTCDHISRLTTSGAGVDPDIQAFHDKECFA